MLSRGEDKEGMARGREGEESEVSLELRKERKYFKRVGVANRAKVCLRKDQQKVYWIWRSPWFGLLDTESWENHE